MSIAPLPTPLQHLGGRRFSFYPPIRNLSSNQFLYRRATWSEFVVASTSTGEEFFISRTFLGEVSHEDEPVMLVRLLGELEYRNGHVAPSVRKVIEFPVRPQESVSAAPKGLPAQIVNIRLETRPDSRGWKWAGVAAVLGAVALTIVSDIARSSHAHQRGDVFRGSRSYLQLGPEDNYQTVVSRLGTPTDQKSRETSGQVFRTLVYGSRHFSVLLMGQNAEQARYVGTVDQYGRVLHSVLPRDAVSTSETERPGLRSLPTF